MEFLGSFGSRNAKGTGFSRLRLGILATLIVFVPFVGVQSAPQQGSPAVPMAKPEQVGFSAELPQKIHDVVKKHIDAGDTPGVIVLVARNGKVVYWEAQGVVDEKMPTPLAKDTVFSVASMTKPIVATSVMMMVEEGKISLDDPASKFIPEFKTPSKVRVLKPGSPPPAAQGQPRDPNAPKPQYDLVSANRPITVRDLLTHTSGIQAIGVPKPELPPVKPTDTLQTWTSQLGVVPLEFQPGTKWAYSNGAGFDVLARIVEVASGQTYDQFLKQRVFDPLGMESSGFGPRKDLASRNQWLDDNARQNPCRNGAPYFCGSAGLWIPADDYWRFSEMLLNKGKWNGKRLLKESSVEEMSANHVGDMYPGFTGIPAAGMGFGYSMEVVLDHTAANLALPNGTFGWNGVGTRQFWVMPAEKAILIMYLPAGKPAPVHRDIESAVISSIQH